MAELMGGMFKLGGAEHALRLSWRDGRFSVHTSNRAFDADCASEGDSHQIITLDGKLHSVVLAKDGDRFYIHAAGEAHEIEYIPAVRLHAGNADDSKSDHLLAPMPGAVIACTVKPGDIVQAGDLLMVIESMKLEMPFKAWRQGRIAAVNYQPGQSFERDKILLSMAPAEAG